MTIKDSLTREPEYLFIKGAREHNLRNIDVKIPRNSLTVITGLSGSGKSSLAFDTIYAEGQRRYVESLSSYARQFLGLMEKPDVDFIEGLSPAISIEQKGTAKNPRSTVGTVTEIYDYLRLLFARIGTPHCVKCGKPITQQTVEQIVETVLKFEDDTRLMVLAPFVAGKKGEHK
ncbi:MAG TPA: excinuclease ABC subunit UvrA, partial [candidate division Zixibacteria bacterium]|nr:excinuclease ABC subunit UvrA [candidate division Zixibacteria bacterium]